ncbi:MAG: hypothetical protein H6747_10550 [Deltaproteobacteria bacterium]|nr:hypothetical protein [Deltaproteobacteria bacterium]
MRFSFLATCLTLGLLGCQRQAAPVAEAQLPPPQPFQSAEGVSAKGWSVPQEHAGEVMSRLHHGEKLDQVLTDLQRRDPKVLRPGSRPAGPAAADRTPHGAPAPHMIEGDEKPAVARVSRRFELIEGKPVRVKEVEARSGMWRIVFSGAPQADGKTGPDREVWVSSDGQQMFGPGIELPRDIETLEADRAFARCLRDAGVRAFIDPRHADGRAMLAALGRFAGLVLLDCSTELAACHAAGVRTLPAVAVRGTIHAGPKDRKALTALTGCK